ncbi:MAG TPA: DUF1638 domain-containing protein [Clostridia bacterium]|nr:DUF1638 domain-containing protein [Clostridia bacterium]
MRLRLISCEVFSRPAYMAAASSANIIDMIFTRMQSHTEPGQLRAEIQSIIDSTPDGYDAVLLGYGLCGNGTAGLRARSQPLVIPRAHDCCTIFLGGREAFQEHFGPTPSAKWYTACYYERLGNWYPDNPMDMCMLVLGMSYQELLDKYGEENARYVVESLKTEKSADFLTYIELPGFDNDSVREEFKKHAADEGKSTRFIEGSTRIIEDLVNARWAEEDFLTVPPGMEIKAVYDREHIFGL